MLIIWKEAGVHWVFSWPSNTKYNAVCKDTYNLGIQSWVKIQFFIFDIFMKHLLIMFSTLKQLSVHLYLQPQAHKKLLGSNSCKQDRRALRSVLSRFLQNKDVGSTPVWQPYCVLDNKLYLAIILFEACKYSRWSSNWLGMGECFCTLNCLLKRNIFLNFS